MVPEQNAASLKLENKDRFCIIECLLKLDVEYNQPYCYRNQIPRFYDLYGSYDYLYLFFNFCSFVLVMRVTGCPKTIDGMMVI